MKKLYGLLALCLACLCLAGCSDKDLSQPENSNAVVREAAAAVAQPPAPAEGVDVDLTVLSNTVAFGELFNMVVSPDNYMGKTVRMRGSYFVNHSEESGNYYHYVMIADAAACCQQGLEFVLNGDTSYPEDYPAENARIEVTGVFDSYEVFGYAHYPLRVDDIVILQ